MKTTKLEIKPDYIGFASDVLRDWTEGFDLEGYELQQLAIKHGLLIPIEGGFDPEVHECPHGCSEKGDPWYTTDKGIVGVWNES